MFEKGDKFIVELDTALVNSDCVFEKSLAWKLKNVENVMFDNETLSRLGRFDEGVWIRTLDTLREELGKLKVENKRLKEENALKNQIIQEKEEIEFELKNDLDRLIKKEWVDEELKDDAALSTEEVDRLQNKILARDTIIEELNEEKAKLQEEIDKK